MTEEQRKVYQGIRAIEAFEYENTKSGFKYYYWEKWKTMSVYRLPGTQVAFSGKVTPDIDVFTDEPVCQYNN